MHFYLVVCKIYTFFLTLIIVQITTEADDKFCEIFLSCVWTVRLDISEESSSARYIHINIICFRTKIKLTGDLTVFKSDIDFGIVINSFWNSMCLHEIVPELLFQS